MREYRVVRIALVFGLAGGMLACGGGGGGGGGSDASVDGARDATMDGATDAADLCATDVDCDDALFCDGLERCAPAEAGADARGCIASAVAACDTPETCDEDANRCLTECDLTGDQDGDGHLTTECGGDDCDDADANRYPGNVEICDPGSHDEDCDPETFGFIDADMDGVATDHCCNVAADGSFNCGGDCDDGNGSIHPGAGDGPPAACDGLDNDCDGTVDESCPCTEGETQPCGANAAQIAGIGGCEPGTQICSGGAFTAECVGGRGPQPEICDSVDNDCDGSVDNGVLRTYYEDGDGDGFGVDGTTTNACSPPDGWAANTLDCDDTNPAISPVGTEVCDGTLDENCNGLVDEGLTHTYYLDADSDGFGDMSMSTEACFRPDGYADNATDCDDAAAAVNRAASEICDRVDNNCNHATDEGCSCTDGDHQSCGADDGAGGILVVGACAAGEQLCIGGLWGTCVGAVGPATEVCNAADDDCDGLVDEGVKVTFYRDADGDGFGKLASSTAACTPPAGYVRTSTDCDDAVSAVHPGIPEVCDGVDNDCDGTTDLGCDCTDGATRACGASAAMGGYLSAGRCVVGLQVCVGGGYGGCIGAVRPATEVCNGLDDDCDGSTDEGTTASCYQDGDGDGRGTGVLQTVCAAAGGGCPTGFAAANGDCNDANANVYPGNTESCNAVDDDCDGLVDEGGGRQCTQNQILPCTTPCGTSGLHSCDSACMWREAVCSAPTETCNYCDDTGDGTLDDETPLATRVGMLASYCSVTGTVGGAASCHDLAGTNYALLSAYGAAGSYWADRPTRFGYGGFVAEATVKSEGGSASATEGWALVIANDTGSTLGSGAGSLGVPYTRHGLSIDWNFNGTSADTLTARHLTGTGTGAVVLGPSSVTAPNTSVNDYSCGLIACPVTQHIRVTYQPANTFTGASETLTVQVEYQNATMTFEGVLSNTGFLGTTPVNLSFAPGDSLRIGLVTPGGAKVDAAVTSLSPIVDLFTLTSAGQCSTPEGSLRVIGDNERAGRLEVFHGGQWGSVCDDAFDASEANVACRQLGFSSGTVLLNTSVKDGVDPIWMDELGCTGSESRLDECSFGNGTYSGGSSCGGVTWGCHDCTHAEDVGVSCTP